MYPSLSFPNDHVLHNDSITSEQALHWYRVCLGFGVVLSPAEIPVTTSTIRMFHPHQGLLRAALHNHACPSPSLFFTGQPLLSLLSLLRRHFRMPRQWILQCVTFAPSIRPWSCLQLATCISSSPFLLLSHVHGVAVPQFAHPVEGRFSCFQFLLQMELL